MTHRSLAFRGMARALAAGVIVLTISGCSNSNESSLPAVSTVSSAPSPYGSLPLLEATRIGGLCANAQSCRSTVAIARNGRVIGSHQRVDVDGLARLVDNTDYGALRSRRFQGSCPTAHDGIEVIYTFEAKSGPQSLSTCSYVLDDNNALIRAANDVLGRVEPAD